MNNAARTSSDMFNRSAVFHLQIPAFSSKRKRLDQWRTRTGAPARRRPCPRTSENWTTSSLPACSPALVSRESGEGIPRSLRSLSSCGDHDAYRSPPGNPASARKKPDAPRDAPGGEVARRNWQHTTVVSRLRYPVKETDHEQEKHGD